jgi:carbamate kinase
MYQPDGQRTLVGVEAVIDKDLAGQLLAREVGAELLVMATDVDGVDSGWGTPERRRLGRVTPGERKSPGTGEASRPGQIPA